LLIYIQCVLFLLHKRIHKSITREQVSYINCCRMLLEAHGPYASFLFPLPFPSVSHFAWRGRFSGTCDLRVSKVPSLGFPIVEHPRSLAVPYGRWPPHVPLAPHEIFVCIVCGGLSARPFWGYVVSFDNTNMCSTSVPFSLPTPSSF
jgi:hypothetical protein